MSKLCRQCGAKCCRYFCLEIDKPDTYQEFEDIRWFVAHKGVSVHVDEDGDWYLSVMAECRQLDADGLCTDYDNRPAICRRYSTDGCDHTQGDYEYQAEFRDPQDVEAFARKTLGDDEFVKARARLRKKLEPKPKKKTKKAKRKK